MKRDGAIALTGGIACGKSEVAGFLARLGVPVLDTDMVGHRLLEPGQDVHERVVSEFGRGILRAEGGIDRRVLGAIVFADAAARARLNAIVHPSVYHEVDRWLAGVLTGSSRAVAMIPLLFETGAEKHFESVIVVASDEDHVLSRLQARGLTHEQARQRIAAQWPVGEKVARADAVIWNNGSLADLEKETLKIWSKLEPGKEEQP